MDKGKEIGAIFFDLRKAFDSVSHWLLLEKLLYYEHILSWLFSYLCGRVQTVVLDGKTSMATPVISGVPQGSVHGSLLFLIYFNDSVSEQLNLDTNITMYVDDLLLHREINCPEDHLKLEQVVNKIANWINGNKLTLNSKKCKYIIVSRRCGRSAPSCTPTLNGQPLDRVHQYKYLGVLLTDNLTWSTQISEITSKARRIIGLIYLLTIL